ncbi:MAG TPA: serine hydrolase domain-containing protein [Terriglobia bacterium]|nr:serine hydrolase domain-containing protein [Terriglobia bacterium]
MRVIAKWTSAFALFLTLLATASAAEVSRAKPEDVGLSAQRLQRIHELIQRHLDAKSFSGAVTLVARNGRIAHLEAQGLMDIETNKPMATNAMFRIMSMTKPVVGVAVMMLMEEGKIRLNDPVSRFIPQFKDLKVAVPQPAPAPGGGQRGAAPAEARFYTVPADREITIKDLMTHTSGLVSGTISNQENRKVALKGKESNADYIPRLGGVPLEFQPGTRWAYSAQAGFDTLVLVVEVVTGQKFDVFARQRIFEPLGMKDTFFYPAESYNPRIATLYSKTEKGLVKQNNPNFMNGAFLSGGGGLFTTAEDYLQFGLMLVNGGQLNGKRLLSPRTVELMSSVHIPDTLPGRARGESFGLSMRVVSDPAQRGVFLSKGSFGWSGAYGTHFWVDSKEKLVAVYMTQTPNQEARADFETAVMQAIVEDSGK